MLYFTSEMGENLKWSYWFQRISYNTEFTVSVIINPTIRYLFQLITHKIFQKDLYIFKQMCLYALRSVWLPASLYFFFSIKYLNRIMRAVQAMQEGWVFPFIRISKVKLKPFLMWNACSVPSSISVSEILSCGYHTLL